MGERLRLIHSAACPDCGAREGDPGNPDGDHHDGCPRMDTCGQCVVGTNGWVPSDELHPNDTYVESAPGVDAGAVWFESWHRHLDDDHRLAEAGDV